MNIGLVQGNNYSALIKKAIGEEKVTNIEELSEAEKLENFKKEIWNELDSYPWDSRVNISIQITDSAFKRMMTDEDFKNRMMKIMYEEASGCRPPIMGSMTNIDENGYNGITYNEYVQGKAVFNAHSKTKDSFYVKKAIHKQDYVELWEEKRHEREIQREKKEKAYEEQLYLKQHWDRKERVASAYEATMMMENM